MLSPRAIVRAFRNRLRHRRHEYLGYLYSLAPCARRDQRRVLLLGQGRTGSTLLESLLDSTGYFKKSGELLNPAYGEICFPLAFIRGYANYRKGNVLFHLKFYHLSRDRARPVAPGSFVHALYNDGWKIIHLRRRNKVRHVLSNFVAEHRGEYHKFDNRKETFSIRVDCDKLVEKIAEKETFETEEASILRGIDFHEVIYEDDLESSAKHQETVDRILDYLSLPRAPASTPHNKINVQPLDDLITNYKEFRECLRAHGWDGYVRA